MHHVIRMLLVVVIVAPAALGQEFVVSSSSPANGQVGVAQVDTVRFTFSEPLAAAEFATATVVLFTPLDAVEVDYANASLSSDGRTVSYPVVHDAGTDFVVAVIGARAASGSTLSLPYALNYTTSASHGTRHVSGTVAVGSPRSITPRGAIVALVNVATLQISAATVVQQEGGAYQVQPVRSGVYAAFAVLIPDIETGSPLLYGFYDVNGDGEPDPVIALFGNPSNINITLVAPEPVTAHHRLAHAVDVAEGAAPDQNLVAVYATPVDPAGRAPMWVYEFHSPSLGVLTRVIPTGLIDITQTFEQPEPPGATIDLAFIDSDDAVETAENYGGSDFRDLHPNVVMSADGRTAGELGDDPSPVWRIGYHAGATDSLVVFIDMVTGAVVPISVEGGPDEVEALLGATYPNPFVGEATLTYSMPEGGHVSIRVFDLLGREVVVLQDGPVPAGAHAVRWSPDPGLSSGVYVVRLEAMGVSRARRVLLVR